MDWSRQNWSGWLERRTGGSRRTRTTQLDVQRLFTAYLKEKGERQQKTGGDELICAHFLKHKLDGRRCIQQKIPNMYSIIIKIQYIIRSVNTLSLV